MTEIDKKTPNAEFKYASNTMIEVTVSDDDDNKLHIDVTKQMFQLPDLNEHRINPMIIVKKDRLFVLFGQTIDSKPINSCEFLDLNKVVEYFKTPLDQRPHDNKPSFVKFMPTLHADLTVQPSFSCSAILEVPETSEFLIFGG